MTPIRLQRIECILLFASLLLLLAFHEEILLARVFLCGRFQPSFDRDPLRIAHAAIVYTQILHLMDCNCYCPWLDNVLFSTSNHYAEAKQFFLVDRVFILLNAEIVFHFNVSTASVFYQWSFHNIACLHALERIKQGGGGDTEGKDLHFALELKAPIYSCLCQLCRHPVHCSTLSSERFEQFTQHFVTIDKKCRT